MKADFPRIFTLLRKERGLSQKNAAAALGISQALLSHYEKGIRECGLDFLVRAADFYGVSCDYLLGRSPSPDGLTLSVDELPGPESAGKENTITTRAGALPLLNKKLIANSLNILFDLLAKSGSKALVQEVSTFLMLAVYRMFRVVYAINPKNQQGLFSVPKTLASGYADASMQICEANALALGAGEAAETDALPDAETLALSTEQLSAAYPLFASSLLNLIRNSESRIRPRAPKG